MNIKFGPGGLGPVETALKTLEEFNKNGLSACEIEFTYGIYIKEKDAKKIKEAAEKNNIRLSIHSQYWINLNSEDEEKVSKSKKRIIDCCKIGEELGAKIVVFHPGYYGKKSKEETYEKIKKEIMEIQEEINKNKWKIKIAPETTGKINVFGSIDEIKSLVRDTNCSFTIDFAHLLARSGGKMGYKEMVKSFEEFDSWHCHFSGIEFGDKGEKNHKNTEEREITELLTEIIKTKKEVVIINESPQPFSDAIKSVKIYNKLISKKK
jgi:deoxyribonuclease IV